MSQQPIYGYPCVTDPRDFLPDAECCSPAELAAHKLACQTFGTPDYQPPAGCTTDYDESGQFVRHVLRTSWGIGTNLVASCDTCHEPCSDLITCHDCGGYLEFCGVCWSGHDCIDEKSAR